MISVLFMGILPGGGLLLYEYMVYERHENSEFFGEEFLSIIQVLDIRTSLMI